MHYANRHRNIVVSLMAVTLCGLSVALPAYGQASYVGHADGSLTIVTPAGGGFTFTPFTGLSNQATKLSGTQTTTTNASSTTTSTTVTGTTDITGNTNAPQGFSHSSATVTDAGFDLTNNTGSLFTVTYDWTGNISGTIQSNPNGYAKVSSSFELCYIPLGGSLNILDSISINGLTPPNANFSQTTSGEASVTIPNGGTSTLFFNLDPEGEAFTAPEGQSLMLFGFSALGPLGYALWRRRKCA